MGLALLSPSYDSFSLSVAAHAIDRKVVLDGCAFVVLTTRQRAPAPFGLRTSALLLCIPQGEALLSGQPHRFAYRIYFLPTTIRLFHKTFRLKRRCLDRGH